MITDYKWKIADKDSRGQGFEDSSVSKNAECVGAKRLMISVIDYGMGNLRSVSKAIETTGVRVKVTDRPEDVLSADAVVLPGVGAFRAGINELKKRNLIEPILKTIEEKKPFLGICLGLQLLCETGTEGDGDTPGMGVLPGKTVRFQGNVKIPHIGWNTVKLKNNSILLKDIPDETFFYFVHSFYFECTEQTAIAGVCEYGVEFPAALEKGNVYATQFHPEKSQNMGIRVLRNFAGICSE